MKIAWAFAARQRQADAVVEQRGALLAANRHEICQEANAECLLRSNTPEQAALRVAT